MYLNNNTELQGGRYKVVRHISSGGFGNTYEGLHVMLDKRVAIKEFFVKDFCNRDEITAQVTTGTTAKKALVEKLQRKFIDEARSLCRLEHPHIVHVYDVFEENGTAYYVMDYIDGQSLNDIIKKEGPLSEVRALKYIRQVADALAYVHGNNRLHLDIKPGNIMLDSQDNAYLIDFGTSKQYDEENGENTSTLLGMTPGYAPLEQMSKRVQTFSAATDIYSLGATFYKILTDITPPDATERANEDEQLKPLPATISQSTRAAIDKAMQVQRKNRPQSIKEFLAILEAKDIEETEVTEIEYSEQAAVVDHKTKPTEKAAQTTSSKAKDSEKSANTTSNSNKKIVTIACFLVGFIVVGLLSWFISKPSSYENNNIGQVLEPVEELYDSAASQSAIPADVAPKIESVDNATFRDINNKKFTYTGRVVDGKPEGKGFGEYQDGSYSGEYSNGYRQGEGLHTYKDGSYFKGTYKKDKAYNGSHFDKDNTLLAEVKNGKEKEVEQKPEPVQKTEPVAANTTASQPSQNSTNGRKKTITVNGVSFNMIRVEGGMFTMGATEEQSNGYSPDSDEKPTHSVTLSSYYIGETEVTQGLWYAVMGQKPTASGYKWESSYGLGDNYPAYYISYNDCKEFISRLNRLTGENFRFPTEAEWEYAARGGNKSQGYIFSGSNDVGAVAWYAENSSSKTHPVGTKRDNELGIYDMSGNVWEWCYDWYDSSYYSNGSLTNPKGSSSGSFRVFRGGGWRTYAARCRVASRFNDTPGIRFNYLGLRLAL